MAEFRVGIDVGGTGIKGAVVNTSDGELVSERVRVPTPQPSTPDEVVSVIVEIVAGLELEGTVGVGFPSVVVNGLASTANNIDDAWIGTNVRDLLADALGRTVVVVNDADAAALAETRFGTARGMGGKLLVLTFGTGIGSGLIVDGALIPNLELGQMEFRGVQPAELKYSARGREERGISWRQWGDEVAGYIELVSTMINPDLIIFGGGACKEWDKFSDRLPESLGVVRAEFINNAGIVGAALLAANP